MLNFENPQTFESAGKAPKKLNSLRQVESKLRLIAKSRTKSLRGRKWFQELAK